MNLNSMGQTFLRRVVASGFAVETSAPTEGIDLMLQFNRELRAEGQACSDDSDSFFIHGVPMIGEKVKLSSSILRWPLVSST